MTLANNGSRFVLTPRFIVGAGLALMGIVLTLDQLGVADADRVLRFWPLLIVAYGVQQFFNSTSGRSVNGIIWMAIGGWLLLNSLSLVRVRIWDLFWPAILIFVGVNLVRQTLQSNRTGPDTNERATLFAVLSGVRHVNGAGRFRGGDLTGFMGGGHLDLRQATIPRGEEASIEILAVMAGFEIIVPPDWVVTTPLVAIMGGVEDKRLAAAPAAPAMGEAAAPRLVLRGFVMMGGVTIRS
jgi:predicted membrane protein